MTISYNRLGSNGRLGNQMFQYAALRGIAANGGFNWLIPRPESYGDSNYGLFDCFKMSSVQESNFGMLNAQSLSTGQFHFMQEFFDNCPDDVNLHDYFTTEKYFSNVKDVIKEDYTFKDEILNPCKEIFEELEDPIFLHVRRSDYLVKPEAHPVCPIEYYQEALTHFKEESPVLVFSDDIEWCKEQELFSGDQFMISESGDHYVDLCLMSLCKHHIIANSSFSWWGAWLSESDNVIAPIKWFGDDNQGKDTKDLIPERWTRI